MPPNPQIADVVSRFLLLDDSGRRAVEAQVASRTSEQEEEEEKPLPLISMRDYLKTDLPVPPELVKPHLVVREGLVVTVARSGKGKTVFNLNRLIRWAAGLPFMPEAPVPMTPMQPLKSLIIENEGAAALFQRQVRKMIEDGPFTSAQRDLILDNLILYGDGGYQDMRVDSRLQKGALIQALDECRPDILFIEPLRHLHSKDENSAQDMSNVLGELLTVAHDYGLCVLTAHHERKSGAGEDGDTMSGARGSTVLEGAVTVMENLRHIPDQDYTEVSWSKSRYDERPDSIRLKWDADSQWYSFVSEEEMHARIVEALDLSDGNSLTGHALADAIGEKIGKTKKIANEMVKSGAIKRGSQGRDTVYRTTSGDDSGLDY